ncbi:MAG TPA: tetratricopeptide repeat protein [Vicinamibacteria bacterium]|nr:tetratricopeptide repeat protein [Vicinamibacteria bacterium]
MPEPRLDSWKEIAAHLGRSVRTVQRWERHEGLPVRRLQHDKQGSVYAIPAELDAWWEERRTRLADEPGDDAPAAAARRRSLSWLFGLGAALLIAGLLGTMIGRPVTAAPRRLAVLPFANLTGDPEREFLSDGVTEMMIAELGRRRDLSVIGRSSVLAYKAAPRPASGVRRELGVDYVLEGSLREAGGALRVAVRLVDARDDTLLWNETYDRPAGDLLAIESEVAQRVADEIHLRLPAPPGERASPEAHVAYLRGRYHWNRRTADGFREGLAYFREAVTLDPAYARAWCGLADTYLLMATYGYGDLTQAEAAARAREAARKALALDGSLGEAHASMGQVLRSHDWDFAGAERSFRRSIELAPSYANARLWLGLMLMNRGQLPEARAVLQAGLDVDPASTTLAVNLGYCDLYAGRAEEALRRFDSLRQRDRERPLAGVNLARALLVVGRADEAIRLVEPDRTGAHVAEPHLTALLAYAYARAGRRADAERMVDALESVSGAAAFDQSLLAVARAAIGRDAEALDALERAVAERQGSVLTMKMDPELASLRGQPRFEALLQKIGL